MFCYTFCIAIVPRLQKKHLLCDTGSCSNSIHSQRQSVPIVYQETPSQSKLHGRKQLQVICNPPPKLSSIIRTNIDIFNQSCLQHLINHAIIHRAKLQTSHSFRINKMMASLINQLLYSSVNLRFLIAARRAISFTCSTFPSQEGGALYLTAGSPPKTAPFSFGTSFRCLFFAFFLPLFHL